jgi:hypothetical protein
VLDVRQATYAAEPPFHGGFAVRCAPRYLGWCWQPPRRSRVTPSAPREYGYRRENEGRLA